MKRQIALLFSLAFFCLLASCSQKSEYDLLVEKELASNVKQDSLFLGIRFDMDRKEFFGHCWELNKQGVLTNGGTKLSVQYNLPTELKFPATFNFYPTFGEDKIFEMPVDIMYNDFSPWVEEMKSEQLLEDVRGMLEDWYGGTKFIEVESKDGTKKLLVKVDGNRRIRLWKESISSVRITYTDLLDLEKAKKSS